MPALLRRPRRRDLCQAIRARGIASRAIRFATNCGREPLEKAKSGHIERYDTDPEYRLNMQASGFAREIFFDDGEPVG